MNRAPISEALLYATLQLDDQVGLERDWFFSLCHDHGLELIEVDFRMRRFTLHSMVSNEALVKDCFALAADLGCKGHFEVLLQEYYFGEDALERVKELALRRFPQLTSVKVATDE